jgi:hypothetical protein
MRYAITTTLLLTISSPLFAQAKGKPLEVSIQNVNDRRTAQSFAAVVITVELPKIKTGDVSASRVILREATDENGSSLLEESDQEVPMQNNGALMYSSDTTSPFTLNLQLKSPSSRSVTMVKSVRGEMELYMPGRDPNSTATIPKFMTMQGKAVANKALKANGIEVSIVSPAQFEAEKKKLAEKRRVEAKAEGYDEASLAGVVESFLSMFFTPQESDIVLKVKDPQKKIQEIVYVDAKGERKPAMMREEEGFTVLSTWSEKPGADWTMKVNMKTSKNVTRHPFELTNIKLP